MSENLFIDYELFLEVPDKLTHQRLINLLIETNETYFKKDKGFIVIKNNYWDLNKKVQKYLDNNAEKIHWI